MANYRYDVVAKGETGTWLAAYEELGDAQRAAEQRRSEGFDVTIEPYHWSRAGGS